MIRNSAAIKARHDDVRPAGGRAPHSEGGKHDGDIAGGIIARTEPDEAYIGVAILVADEDEHVGGKRHEADRAHDAGFPHAEIEDTGTYLGKQPVYNSAGTLLGYFPIYA